MNLPRDPGLYRRLAYGEYIRTRHRSRFGTLNIDGRGNRYRYDENDYERLVELEDIKLGLSDRELSCIFKDDVFIKEFFCSICQEQDDKKSPVLAETLLCDHTFHYNCIRIWLSKNKTCPVCRLDLSSD